MDKCYCGEDEPKTFTFNFREHDVDGTVDESLKAIKYWVPAARVEVSTQQILQQYQDQDSSVITNFPRIYLRLIRSQKVLRMLENNVHGTIPIDQLRHTDLIPAVYEGGLKVWEATYDFGKFLLVSNIRLQGKKVLDLGCGVGVMGLIALYEGATVHFQDYNLDVINCVTIPNVFLNFPHREEILKKCEFYYGDWETFATLKTKEDKIEKFDYIFTSETIYNPLNYHKLFSVFKNRMTRDGAVYIACKSNYFGVGGGARVFEKFMTKDNVFDLQILWRNVEGMQREIMKLTWKRNDEM